MSGTIDLEPSYSGEIPEVVPQNLPHNQEQRLGMGGCVELQTRWDVGWVIQYADDVKLLKVAAEAAYNILSPWFRRARMQLNADKTHWVYFAT